MRRRIFVSLFLTCAIFLNIKTAKSEELKIELWPFKLSIGEKEQAKTSSRANDKKQKKRYKRKRKPVFKKKRLSKKQPQVIGLKDNYSLKELLEISNGKMLISPVLMDREGAPLVNFFTSHVIKISANDFCKSNDRCTAPQVWDKIREALHRHGYKEKGVLNFKGADGILLQEYKENNDQFCKRVLSYRKACDGIINRFLKRGNWPLCQHWWSTALVMSDVALSGFSSRALSPKFYEIDTMLKRRLIRKSTTLYIIASRYKSCASSSEENASVSYPYYQSWLDYMRLTLIEMRIRSLIEPNVGQSSFDGMN